MGWSVFIERTRPMKKLMRWRRIFGAPQLHVLPLFLVAIVASCTYFDRSIVDVGGNQRAGETALRGPATPSSTQDPKATGPPPEVRLLAIPTTSAATWTPIAVEGIEQLRNVTYANSDRVQMGQYYEFSVYTHCGADFAVDFDGSLWQLNNPEEVPSGLRDPSQKGWMILIDENYARFEFEAGSILYIRHDGPQQLPFCE